MKVNRVTDSWCSPHKRVCVVCYEALVHAKNSITGMEVSSSFDVTHYRIRSERGSSAVRYPAYTFLPDSSNVSEPARSLLKRSNTNASKPPLLQAMTHSQTFPQDDTLSPKLDSDPASKALHSIRLKIQQQKIWGETLTSSSEIKHPKHLTRKVCRVPSKEAKTAPSTGGVIRLTVQKHAVSSVSNNACHQRSAHLAEQSTYISAWKNVQGLVKQMLNSQSSIKDKSECLYKKAPPQQCAVSKARRLGGHEQRKKENSASMKAQDQSRSISRCPSGSAASSRPTQAVQLKNRNEYCTKASQNSTLKFFTESHHHENMNTLVFKDNENDAKSNNNPVQEVREYMRHQAVERKRKVLKMKKETEREDEKKLRNMHEVFRKQREALHKANKEQTQEYKHRRSSDEERCTRVPDAAEEQMDRQNQSVLVRAEQVDHGSVTRDETGSPVSAAVKGETQNRMAAQRHRAEALKKTIAALDTRLDDEGACLGITDHRAALIQTQPAGQGICKANSRESLSDSSDRDTDLRRKGVSVENEIKDETGVEREFKQQINQTATAQEEQSEDSESTDSSSKWSELSELYSQQIHSHLSLAQSQQFLREEELRARQYSALFRLREIALWEKTQAELEWLEHCIRHGAAPDDDFALAEHRRKQEAVVYRFRQEQAEIHHWRNIYRSSRQQRRLLLHHQRDILKIKKSTVHFKQVLQEQSVPKKSHNLRRDYTATEEESVMQPGIMPDARGAYKASGEDGSLLSKAGLRRLLQSDEVWTLARKRNQVELVPGEQDILQFTESNNPPTSPSHRYARQSTQAPIRLINPERKGAGPPCQRDPVKTSKVGPDVNDQDAQKKVPGFYEDTRTSKSIESCRGERFQYPAEENLKPVLNKQQFTHDHKPNPDSDIRFHTGSNVSTDTPQDLQSHSDESHLKLKDSENIKTRTLVHGTETTALNVKNNQRSKNVLLLNNNHDICNEDSKLQWKSSAPYHKSDRDCKFPETSTVADAPLIGNLILNTLSADTRNAEDSPCKIDEKVFSHHSESLTCSEKKKDHLKEKNTDTSTFSVVYAEKYTVVPEVSQFELDFNNKDGDGCNSGRTIAESLLSEILSPVDEVLSYGSAELPSVKGGAESGLYSYSGPPHPAFEIITWTSEEELPAPPESPEDLSINSENVPPLPVDLRRREHHRLGSLRDEEIANGDLSTSLPPSVCEDDCSEYTSSLPEDLKHEISDPLSSFQIGDRVLVCNSRPGVLKYKGLTAFADGFWAGVALDTPNGNHNGTFRGVKYFSCDKSHGVLVRAEDVSHIHREHGTYIETVVDEDPFSDEEPPRHEPKKDTSSSAGAQGGDTNMKDDPKSTHQKESQEDISNGAKNLLYTSKIALPKIDTELIHHNKENRHLVDDSAHSVTRLIDESMEDIIRCTEDIRRRRRRTKSMHDNTHINTQDARKNEDSFLTPRLLEQWHQAPPDMPLKIKVQPHDDPVVYRLVDAAVDILCGQANEEALDGCETPNYLLDDKSCKAYRQVIFQLTSDVLQDILGDLLGTKQSYHNICNESVISALPSCNISITLLKAAVKKEIQKTLNLERNEQHMTEMLQKLCKYWYAKRDRVDYILIQELHNDERTWQDYTADQYTVKMRLTEEIFSILLDDTIVTLNHMHY